MLWCIYMIDKPNVKDLRLQTRVAHSAYMAEREAKLFYAGPLQTDDGEGQVGSMWIISADTAAEAQAFADNEPMNKAGVFASRRINRTRGAHFHPELAAKVAVNPLPAGASGR